MADAADFVLVGARSLGLFSAGDRNVGRVDVQETTGTGPRANVYADSVLRDREPACLCGHTCRVHRQQSKHRRRPSCPVLTRRYSGRATREPAPRCCREPAAILPTSIAILHRTPGGSSATPAPTPASRPTTPAQPTQISVSAVPARDAGGLRCRARVCASATGVRREELARPGRSGGQTGRAPIRSGSGSAADLPATDGPQGPAAPEPTCDWWKRCWDGRRSGSWLARPGERSSASPTPPGVGVTSGRCACSRRAATRKRWIPSLPATPSSYSAR